MRKGSLLSLNKIWIAIVLFHTVGAVAVSLIVKEMFWSMEMATALWIFMGAVLRKKESEVYGGGKRRFACCCIACAAGWAVTIYLLCFMTEEAQESFLLNVLLLAYAAWVCTWEYDLSNEVRPHEQVCVRPYPGRYRFFRKYICLKKISPTVILLLMAATLFLFVAADYINACSMLIFQNYLDASMERLSVNPTVDFIVAAVIPAIVEELYFRGFIYRGIPDRKMAVFISALLFALLHMNFNQMSYAFFMGLAFGGIIYATDNLSITILIHMLFNGSSVVFVCFPENEIISGILSWKLAGYALFAPSVTDAGGKLQLDALLVGGGIFLFCLVMAGCLIFLLGKAEKRSKISPKRNPVFFREGDSTEGKTEVAPESGERKNDTVEKRSLSGKTEGWMPDFRFFVGCALCLLTAVLYEMIL